jgi:hypothetical protein
MRGRAAVLLAALAGACATPSLPRVPLPDIELPKFTWVSALWPFGRDEKPAAPATPIDPRAASLGEGVGLTLPVKPGYPETVAVTHTVVARQAGRTVGFQAALSLSPEAARITLIAPGGPRILTLDWTEAGVAEDRTILTPSGLRGVDVLADIFLCLWPVETVRATLGEGVRLEVDGATRRVIAADRTVVEITSETTEKGATRFTLRNLDRDYALAITADPPVSSPANSPANPPA